MATSSKKFLLLLCIILVVVILHSTSITQYTTLEYLKTIRLQLLDMADHHYLLTILGYIMIYLLAVSLSLPFAAPLTVLGGFLFGTIGGTIAANIGATAGATLTFLITRYLIANQIHDTYRVQLTTFNANITRYGTQYLLLARFTIFIPFFLINIGAALTNIPTTTFIWTTSLGIIPASLVYTYAGKSLGTITTLSDVFSIPILSVLILLMGLMIVSILIKKSYLHIKSPHTKDIFACMKKKNVLLILTLLSLGMIMHPHTHNEKKCATATLAGGCFWCMQPPFEHLNGVKSVVVGYANGNGSSATYADYAHKGYVEAIQITFDPFIISFPAILDIFWRQIDPTDASGQFNDRGPQYRPVIFYHTDAQKTDAEASKTKLAAAKIFKKPIVTQIAPFTNFYPAEEYHQHYHDKNPIRYRYYRFMSGRDNFLNTMWSKEKTTPSTAKYQKLSVDQLKKKLTPLQYIVTQQNGTEPAFNNPYWDDKRSGIYVDIVSGEPLFSSHDKFNSGTGWPSFSKALVPENIIEGPDKGWFTRHKEVRSTHANSHLGDLFYDGPKPTGLRYCINSASLRFIPVEELEKEGYGDYRKLF